MAECGIYTIENTVNGHRYIGSAATLTKRWCQHRASLRRGKHHSLYLQRAWNKYGEGAFRFEVLEEWEPEFLASMEQWWMNVLQPEYNISPTAGSCLGVRRSPETRGKLSAALTGKTRPPFSAEWRAKLGAAKKGKKCTQEHKAKISAANMGRRHTPEARAKMSIASKGRQVSSETRMKLSSALKGNKNGLGRQVSAEVRSRISESVKAHWRRCQ